MAEGDQAVAALRDEKSHVRVAAVRSLGERREVSAVPFLVTALHDPAWEVRAAAVWALGAFRGHAPAEVLIEALADEDGSVRAAALRVLAGVRGQVPPEPLARMLHDADWQVHEAVALTVEELGEQAPPGPLVAKSYNENAVEREAAQMPHKPSHPDVLPSLSFTLQRAMQIEVLGDRYQLQDPIGRGGMATIYRGRDMRMDRVVAIKVLREVYNTNPKFVMRFQREAKAASALQHPNIVQVYDYGQTDGNYYIVMELIEGIDLRRYLSARGVLDVSRAVIIAHDVALGLGAAHRRGIVHRDVKPHNILVGRGGSIKLTDFGIASVYKDINARRLTTTGMTLGTVQYYAPEQAQGEIVSPAADVYSLGIVIYEMLTGRTPFDGDSVVAVAWQHIQDAPIPPSQFNPGIPAALEEIILRCLEKAPEMRFRDGSQLARALAMLGDAQLDETVPIPSGRAPILTPAHHIPSRPGNSGHGGTLENVPPDSPASSPDNRVGPGILSDQNNAGHVPGPLVNQPMPDQQSFAPPPGSAVPYQFQHGAVSRSGVVQPDQRDWRSASIITILILLATLLLLGFSVYLAVQLGFITLPFFHG
jgi:serine/threonine protein kinase